MNTILTDNNTPQNRTAVIRLSPLALLLSVLFGCADATPHDQPHHTPLIGFHTRGLEAPSTRADTLKTGDMFGVLAYGCPDGTFYPNSSVPNLLYNASVEKYLSENTFVGFRYIPAIHWPAVGKALFVAYYPHSSSVSLGTITVSPFTLTGLPSFDVVLGNEKRSVDFATAVVGPIQRKINVDDPAGTPSRSEDNVSFSFKRRMSYLQFRCKAVNMPSDTRLFINKIAFRNIYRRGSFNMAANGGNGAWEDLGIDATTGATLNVSSVTTPISTTDFKDLVDPNGVGYRISLFPQTYDNVELLVAYTLEYVRAGGGNEYRIVGNKRIPLSADWQMGKLTIYDIEFAFMEAFGDNVLLNFNVQPWNSEIIDTEM